MAFQNVYHHRKVADTASKACEVCYKPSTSVLVTPDNKDYFFVCPGHLKDKGFCSPIVDESAVAAKKKAEMDAEKERVKQEYEEKQRKKKEKEKEKEKEKQDAKDTKEDAKGEKSVDKKKPDETPNAVKDEEPRVFALQKTFYSSRLEKKRNAEISRRNRERFQNPSLFPTVPKNFP